MKKKLIISVVLAVFFAVSMSIGCFASEATWSLSTNAYISDNLSTVALATASRLYSYHSYSMVLDYSIGVQSLAVVGNNKSSSNINLSVRKTNQSYSSVYNDYINDPNITCGFDVYVMSSVPSKSYSTVDSYTSSYTTSLASYSNSFVPNSNSLYYFRNIDHSYYDIQYVGQLNYSVVFGIQTYTQPHIFYN